MTVHNTYYRSSRARNPAHGRVGSGGRCGPTRSSIREIPHQKQEVLRVGSLNVGTMRGKSSEVAETLSRRGIDVCCLQETRFRGASTRMIDGKDSRYKFFWVGNAQGTGGVGIMLAEKWVEKVLDVKRSSDRVMLIKLLVGKTVVTVLSAYAPQSGLDDTVKVAFYDELHDVVAKVGESEMLVQCGDFNGHIGHSSDGYDGIHGGFGYGQRNEGGDRLLEFAVAHDLVVGNSLFTKKEEHLITYQSGPCQSQIDYILVRKRDFRSVKDIKVICGEECAPQHRLLVGDLRLSFSKPQPQPFVPKRRVWRLKDPLCSDQFRSVVDGKLGANVCNDSPDAIWEQLKSTLLQATEDVCGWTKARPSRKQTWWWNNDVTHVVREKRRLWKEWKKGGSREAYLEAKRMAKLSVYRAKKAAEDRELGDVKSGKGNIFRVANQMRKRNQDVVGEKCVKDDSGSMCFSVDAKKVAWKEHYERLLNIEFPWDCDNLPVVDPVSGPPIQVTVEMVLEAIGKMKSNKAAGPSGVVAEMLKAAGDSGVYVVTQLVNSIISSGNVPQDWNESFVVNCYKGKGDALDRGNYRGLKLLDQVMKVLERVVEKLIRDMVDIDEMQFGFVPGRGTTDAIFILRQLQEKYLAKKKNLYFAFVDLEKAFDRVPRDVLWWSMRKLGVDEWVVRLVQSMYSNSRSRVKVGSSFSDLFDVKVGVHQGSVLSPLLFIIVLEALSREFRTGCPWELLYADDLMIAAETMDELLVKLKTWKDGMEAKGLRVNMGKTKVMCSGLDLNSLKDSGKWPCGVCRSGVGANSIFCEGCSHWVHKKCSHISGPLKADLLFRCDRCIGVARPIDGQPFDSVTIDGQKIDVVDAFCYLGDTVCAGGGCTASVITRCRSAWGKFRELLPILTCRSLSLGIRGKVYNACVRSVLQYASECWALRRDDLMRLIRNDRAMIRWICGVKMSDHICMESLLGRLGVASLELVLRRHRLRWFGHVQRSDSWIKRCTTLDVEGVVGRGRPKKSWRGTIDTDLRAWQLSEDMVFDRVEWRRKLWAAV